jgi:uncharacterized protein YndB with AHSA1/START domain
MTARQISATRIVAADPQTIFDLLADPTRHCEIDGSGTVRSAQPGGPARLSLGAQFGMSMKMGAPYKITNTVVAFDEPRHVAWRHFGKHEWHYRLTPVEGGTEVTETFDYSMLPGYRAKMLELMGFPKRNRVSIDATLDRLVARFN